MLSSSLGCGQGRRVVTGGALWNPSGAGGTPTGSDNLYVSRPDASGKRWRIAGFSDDTTVLRIILLCLPAEKVGSMSVVHAEATGEDTVVVPASCPAGRRPNAGVADWYEDGSPAVQPGTLSGLMVSTEGARWTARAYASGDAALRVTLSCVAA